MWRQAVAKQSLCLPGWMEAYNLCQLLTRKTEDAAATFNLKQNSSREEASVFYEKTNMQYLLEHTQTHTCFLLHVSLLVASLRSKKLWYCQMQAVYLSLKWSQAARNSLKKQVSKIQKRTSSLIRANSLSATLCVFSSAAQLACLMFIFYF